MKLTELLIMRDRVLKESMYDALINDRKARNIGDLHDLIDIVEGAFREGSEAWKEEYFPIMFTENEIGEVENVMTKEEQETFRRAQAKIAKASPS